MAIKSIQRGTISFTGTTDYNTATISSVDTTKTRLRWLGSVGRAGKTVNDDRIYIYLLNSTTVAAQRYHDTSSSADVSFEVIEYS